MIEIINELSVDEYNTLRESVGWIKKDINVVANAIKNSVMLKKAVVDGKIVGMARVLGDGLYYFICDVVVDAEYQKMGIGKKIIDDVILDIERKVGEGQSCSINLMATAGKEAFYEKCGFIKVPFDYHGYGMIKKIEK